MTLKLVLIYKELLEASVAHKTASRPAPTAEPAPLVGAEAAPLHGEDGLEHETLPSAEAPPPQAPER